MLKNKKAIINWSNALFDLIRQNNQFDVYSSAVDVLLRVFTEHYLFLNLMNCQKYSAQQKALVIDQIIPDQDLIYFNHALHLLADNSSFDLVLDILKQLRCKMDHYLNVAYASVFTCVPLTRHQLNTLSYKLSVKFNMTITCINRLQPSLIGGVLIKFKNIVIDGSFAGKLADIRGRTLQQLRS